LPLDGAVAEPEQAAPSATSPVASPSVAAPAQAAAIDAAPMDTAPASESLILRDPWEKPNRKIFAFDIFFEKIFWPRSPMAIGR
jgi:phospholipid-binding lipoprotein MlaA